MARPAPVSFLTDAEVSAAGLTSVRRKARPDPREPDHSRQGIFVYHNCWKCRDGAAPCTNGNPNLCDYPRARND